MRLVISGILGQMGKALVSIAEEMGEFVVAGVDTRRTDIGEIPVYSDVEDLPDNVDCAIDFSSPDGTIKIAEWCKYKNIPLLSGTTGLSEQIIELLHSTAKTIPVYYSSNMSIAIAALWKFVEVSAKIFDTADVEIIELHHRRKADAPSGTAITFAEKIITARDGDKSDIIYGRQGHIGQRPNNQIGIHSIRAGNIVGEHQIIFAFPEEEIIFTHRARDRKLFARGAIIVARWLIRKTRGLYSPEHFIGNKLEV